MQSLNLVYGMDNWKRADIAFNQECMIGKEGEYGTVLQHFTGFMTFVMIFISWFVPVHRIPAVVTVVVVYMSYRLASMPTHNKL